MYPGGSATVYICAILVMPPAYAEIVAPAGPATKAPKNDPDGGVYAAVLYANVHPFPPIALYKFTEPADIIIY